MIVKVRAQLNGDQEPRDHYALVFDDAYKEVDLIPYRNAITNVVKEIVSSSDVGGCLNEEAFWLIQLAGFISNSLDDIIINSKRN